MVKVKSIDGLIVPTTCATSACGINKLAFEFKPGFQSASIVSFASAIDLVITSFGKLFLAYLAAAMIAIKLIERLFLPASLALLLAVDDRGSYSFGHKINLTAHCKAKLRQIDGNIL